MDPADRPRRLTRAEAKARTRSRLVEAAAQEFARKGFGGASVDVIAEAAGFTTGAVYAHFPSKEALFVEVLTQRTADRASEAEALVTAQGDSIDALREGLNHLLVNVADRDADLAPLEAEIWLYAIRRPEVLHEIATQIRRSRDDLSTILAERAQVRDRPDADFDKVATVLMALFRGLVQLRRTDRELVPDDLYGDAARWLFAGLAGLSEQR